MANIKFKLFAMKGNNLQFNTNLHNYTTIKVGGKAEYFAEPQNINELIYFLEWAKIKQIKCHIIGGGSNLLIKNNLLKGLTICTRKLKSININNTSGLVKVESGVMLPTLSNLLGKNGCKGGEWIIGIPGTIGGALFMNAGSGKNYISKNLLAVQVINTKTLKIFYLPKKELSFRYRYSTFQDNNLFIISAVFNFEPLGNAKLIQEKARANLKKKTEVQPYNLPSFGSVFKNPKENFAGKLIEEVGLKGFGIGGAQISTLHSNFIVNNGNASSEDIYQLITLIQQKVLQKKGIFLYPEVRMFGY